MNARDPILEAWVAVRDAELAPHPSAATLALVARRGLSVLDGPHRQHLLSERCERCERRLKESWSRYCPAAHLVEESAQWPAGALRSALEAHLGGCAEPACREAAPLPQRPPVADRVRVTEWLARLGAQLVEVLIRGTAVQPARDLGSGLETAPRPVPPPGVIGEVTLTASEAGDGGVIAQLDLTGRPELHGCTVVMIVFTQGSEVPLAVHELAGAPAPTPIVLDIDPSLIDTTSLRIALGVLD